jgi:hypothetical protein
MVLCTLVQETRGSLGARRAPKEVKKRKVGYRTVIRRPDETVLGRHKEWLLLRLDGWCRDGWLSLKLLRDRRGPKNVWMLGARADRMARNRDLKLLTEHHPDIAAWVEKTARGRANG